MAKETQTDRLAKAPTPKEAEKAAKTASIKRGLEGIKLKIQDCLEDSSNPNNADMVEAWNFVTSAYEKSFTNSSTSSLPPSQDPNREKQPKGKSGKRKTGGSRDIPARTWSGAKSRTKLSSVFCARKICQLGMSIGWGNLKNVK